MIWYRRDSTIEEIIMATYVPIPLDYSGVDTLSIKSLYLVKLNS